MKVPQNSLVDSHTGVDHELCAFEIKPHEQFKQIYGTGTISIDFEPVLVHLPQVPLGNI